MVEEKKELNVGEMLYKRFIQKNGLSCNEVSSAIYVDSARIDQIVKGKRGITVDTDLRLTKFFGLKEGYFLKYQQDLAYKQKKAEIEKELYKIMVFDTKQKALSKARLRVLLKNVRKLKKEQEEMKQTTTKTTKTKKVAKSKKNK